MKYEAQWSEFGVLPDAAHEIRATVFLDEQGFAEEFDARDSESYHVLLLCNGEPQGTARIFWDGDDTLRIGRVAVHKSERGGGYGRELLEQCKKKALEMGAKRLILGAQQHAQGFYEACGMEAYGEPYRDEDCPHIMMRMDITERGA